MNKFVMQKITPHLSFEDNAEEAANFIPLFSKTQKSLAASFLEDQREQQKESLHMEVQHLGL